MGSQKRRAEALAEVERGWHKFARLSDEFKCDDEIVLVAVEQCGWALQFAAESCKRDTHIVLSAVQQDGLALEFASACCRGDPEIVMAAVRQNGMALEFAEDNCRSDPDIVLEAVQQSGCALDYATESYQGDREIVLAAVQNTWTALELADESFCSDREIVLLAAQQDFSALELAADELLEDSTFAPEQKTNYFILKIIMLSGRYTLVVSEGDTHHTLWDILDKACERLEILASRRGMQLFYGSETVPSRLPVAEWPGILPRGQVTEYQLVVPLKRPVVND
eukprot:4706302-Amphidinium_carterae.2